MSYKRKEVIGDCELYLGDCAEVIPALGEMDALITDPPYGIDGASGSEGKKRGKGNYISAFEDTEENIISAVIPAIEAALSISQRGAITPGIKHCFKYPHPKDMGSFIMPSGAGLHFWGRILAQPILYYGDDPRLGKTIQDASKTIKEPMEKIDHPCPKPLQAWTWLVNKASLEGEVVLDPFMGSGTTGISCCNLGRRFVGIEIEENYFDIACERIYEAHRQYKLF